MPEPAGGAGCRVATPGRGGFSTVELLVGATVGVLVLAALAATLGAGGHLLLGAGVRVETDDALAGAGEALAFDVRHAGWDPAAAGVERLTEADADALTIQADLDGDGSIDASSEERVRWLCAAGPPRLSRVVGAQSMPMASDLTACGFTYRDGADAVLAVPPGGLDAPGRAAVRRVVLDVTMRPPGLTAVAARRISTALRGAVP